MSGARAKISGFTFAVVGAMFVVLVYLLRHVLIPFVAAAAFAYVLAPLVQLGRRQLRCPQWVAALLIYLVLVGGIAVCGWRVSWKVYSRASHFSGNPEQQLHLLLARLLGNGQVTFFGYHFDSQQIASQMLSRFESALNGPQAATIAALGASVAFGTVLFLVLLFYFLVQGPELVRTLLCLAPPEHRAGIRELGAAVNPILQRYLRGLCVIVIFASLATWIGARLIFHLPHPLVLAMATGLLELIPIVGPTISATLLGGAAALHGGGTWSYVGLALYWFCLRMSIDQIVGPLVLGHAVNLHPVTVIFAFIAGGVLFGPLGVLLAIPTAAVLKLILDRYYALPIEE